MPYLSMAYGLGALKTNLLIRFPGVDSPTLPAARRKYMVDDFYGGQRGLSRATVGYLSTAVLKRACRATFTLPL
ncbi:MAG TPA: hypothetical protein DIC56_14365 [Rhizobium sp.]|nr:hypothetical protein [Rhizobium sp.]